MKEYNPSVFSKEVWQEIAYIFWREVVECLPEGASGDGVDPVSLQTTKRGIEISGAIWFLLGGRDSPNPRYPLELCLSRPRFSSVESVTVNEVRKATISESYLEDGTLCVTVN